MDLSFTPEQRAWRDEVRRFLDRELPSEYEFPSDFEERDSHWEFSVRFTKKVGDRGWLGLTWPKVYGGLARSPTDRAIMMHEFDYRSAPIVNAVGHGLAASTLIQFGTPEQRRRFLPEILRTETIWVEGLSEPEAGSDLASLRTRAVRDADEWIIEGQKAYITWAHRGDVIYLAARTGTPDSKHRGITLFCVDLDQPGITVQPQENLGGGRQNQVFFDHVRVPADRMLGRENGAWDCIMAVLYSGGDPLVSIGRLRRVFDKVVDYCRETSREGRPLAHDPVVRLQLAELALNIDSLDLLNWETVCRTERDQSPVLGGALAGMLYREFLPRFAQQCTEIVGPMSQLQGGRWAPLRGEIEHFYRQSFGNHGGGTAQLKRVQVATRGLGLPR